MTMWGNMRSDFGKGMNVPVTAAEECSHSFFSPALRLVFAVVCCRHCHPPPSPVHCLIVVFVFVIVVIVAVVRT